MPKLHLVFILLNIYLGFNPVRQLVTKELKPIASLAITTTGVINVPNLIIL